MGSEDGPKEAQQNQKSCRHDTADTWTGPKSRKQGRADSFKALEFTGPWIQAEDTIMQIARNMIRFSLLTCCPSPN